MKHALILISLLLLAIIGSVLAYLNADIATFNFYFSTIDLPLAVLLFLALTAGVIAGVLVSLVIIWHLRRERKRLRQRLKVCEQEIKNLRDIPIKGPY